MSNVERLPLMGRGLTLRSLAAVTEVRHWGCVRTTALMNNREIKPQDFEGAYLVEMRRLWELEDLDARFGHLREVDSSRDFSADLRAARAYSDRSDEALFHDIATRR